MIGPCMRELLVRIVCKQLTESPRPDMESPSTRKTVSNPSSQQISALKKRNSETIEKIMPAQNTPEIEITLSDNTNLAKDMEKSANSGKSSMEVVCAGAVPREDSNAISFRTSEKQK